MSLSLADSTLLSSDQQKKIIELQAAYAAEKDPKKQSQIHDIAQAIRAGAGYDGGQFGNQYIKLPAAVQNVVDSVKNAAQPIINLIMPDASQSSVASAANALTPSTAITGTSSSLSGSADYYAGTTSMVGNSVDVALPTEIKKYALYAGGFVVVMMVLKILTGGRK